MTIVAKYSARCAACGGPIAVGTKIEWSKGSPARHVDCAASLAAGPTLIPAARAPAARRARTPGMWTGCSCGSREDGGGSLIPARNNCASCERDG